MSKFAKKSTHETDYNPNASDYKAIATKENSMVCTVGRMNPPTPGHMKLVRRLILTAVELNLDEVQVFLSGNNKDSKNPLICEEDKKRFLEKMTESMQSKMSEPAKSVHVKFECFANPVVAIFGK
jgi:phosphopantetheine adenylyltransferase